MNNYIKTYEEFTLIKPEPDFSGLTISDKDLFKWYSNYKKNITYIYNDI